jgi:hypothetical protein
MVETFVNQNGMPVGTISFSSSQLKDKAIKKHNQDVRSRWKDWTTSDNFDHLTILYNYGEDSDVEYVSSSLFSASVTFSSV